MVRRAALCRVCIGWRLNYILQPDDAWHMLTQRPHPQSKLRRFGWKYLCPLFPRTFTRQPQLGTGFGFQDSGLFQHDTHSWPHSDSPSYAC